MFTALHNGTLMTISSNMKTAYEIKMNVIHEYVVNHTVIYKLVCSKTKKIRI